MTPRPLRPAPDGQAVEVLDQTLLPHEEHWVRLATVDDAIEAIRAMRVRGAPLIGVTAAYGLGLAARHDPSDRAIRQAAAALRATRPTAVNLAWAVDRMTRAMLAKPVSDRGACAWREADAILDQDVAACRAIGDHGLELLRAARGGRGEGPVQVLTHCNTGWLAAVEYGTALAPVYRAVEEGLAVHVWVAETRPRNQGWLTAWELARAGVPHTMVADNMVGHLIQRGLVDLVLVGTDRTTRRGDVCNKVGTYLRALAAREHGVPFYVAAPSSSIDWNAERGTGIPLEERDATEVTHLSGRGPDGRPVRVALGPEGTAAWNVAFDVTPASLVTGLITERGVCPASTEGLTVLFPEHAS
jgi:methylthioribose-1-phosphate isomerase